MEGDIVRESEDDDNIQDASQLDAEPLVWVW